MNDIVLFLWLDLVAVEKFHIGNCLSVKTCRSHLVFYEKEEEWSDCARVKSSILPVAASFNAGAVVHEDTIIWLGVIVSLIKFKWLFS